MMTKSGNNESISNKNNLINITNNNTSYDSFENGKDKKNKKYKNHKHHQKIGNKCYCLDLLEFFGPINIITKPDELKLYVSHLKLIEFDDHFDELLEKGKNEEEKSNSNNKLSAPDITYFHQRYYYYTKYDEGILMDHECKIYFINKKCFNKYRLVVCYS
jgi:hypothetical protein